MSTSSSNESINDVPIDNSSNEEDKKKEIAKTPSKKSLNDENNLLITPKNDINLDSSENGEKEDKKEKESSEKELADLNDEEKSEKSAKSEKSEKSQKSTKSSKSQRSEKSQKSEKSKKSKKSKKDSSESSDSSNEDVEIDSDDDDDDDEEVLLDLEDDDDEEEEEEEEEKKENEKNVEDVEFDFAHPTPVLNFQYRSISASLIRVVNLYRNSLKLGNIPEDTFLTRVAMNHSLKMANNEARFSNALIKKEIAKEPYAFTFSHVSKRDSPSHAFIDVANEWTTTKSISKAIISKANSIGVGMATSAKRQSFFTLIIALRTDIGDSSLKSSELRSVLLSRRCLDLVNSIRNKYNLLPYVYNSYLSNLAYKFAAVPANKITQKFIESRLPIYSSTHVDLGKIKIEDANPYSVVEEWMRQTQHVEAILGDYNRIGIGFVEYKDYLYSVRIEVRSLHASVIDGTEVLVDNSILAKHVAEEMNEFRDQHSLQVLNLDDDLFKIAQEHAEYIANGSVGVNPITSTYYKETVEPKYKILDISHTTCKEMTRAPKEIMKKWRNNADCVSVLLNYVDDIGVGLCFDDKYICHVTTIIADAGDEKEIVNKIVSL